MKIAICGSLDFIKDMKDIGDQLQTSGHEVLLPKSAEMVIGGEVSQKDLDEENLSPEKRIERKIKLDAIKRHYEKIKESNAILVVNFTKKGIENYIGGNTFLEVGFAHILGKKIFLLNPVPEMLYTDELVAMRPVVINGNLKLID